MDPLSGWPLLWIGAFLLVGYGAHVLGSRAHVPRVTMLLALGVLAGPHMLGLVPAAVTAWFPLAAQFALSIVGFQLGEQFLGERIKQDGRLVFTTALFSDAAAALLVFALCRLAGCPTVLALLLAGVAPATAPAATVDVVRESRADGPVSRLALAVVAVDDAYGILLFTLLLSLAQVSAGGGGGMEIVLHGVWELAGAVGLGVAIGLPMAWLTGRVRPGELTRMEALGFVLLCGGVASVIQVSYLLACMTCGAVVANRASHHTRPFHAIEGISQPFLTIFFLLAGFEFDPHVLAGLGVLGLVYVAARSAGKVAGGWLGARAADAAPAVRRHVGFCLLPQAGVAIGLGLLGAQHFPEHGRTLLTLLVATTFLFELFGPLVTRLTLSHAGETGQADVA